VKLNARQYHDYVKLAAGVGLDTPDGQTLKETLQYQIENEYPLLDGLEKTNENKRIIIKGIIQAYRNQAVVQFFEENPEVLDKLENSIRQKAKAKGRLE
jgi:hypothetical protein